jgi:hypothetical protein
MNGLSASELADLVGTTAAEVDRLVDLGILVTRDSGGPFLETDVQKVRLAVACEQAGLPMDAIAAAIRAGRLSFAFLEAAPYRRWAVRSARTYRQVSQETGIPLDMLGGALEAMGFARVAPEELIREDELEVVPLLQLGLSTGVLDLDLAWLTRIGLPSVPQYWRWTPTEWSPSLGKPVSSTAHAVGSRTPTSRSASRRRTDRQSHGETATK